MLLLWQWSPTCPKSRKLPMSIYSYLSSFIQFIRFQSHYLEEVLEPMRGQKCSLQLKNRRSNWVCLSERYSFGTARSDHFQVSRKWISLISFHWLINQKHEDWNSNKEKNFYPQGNWALFFYWWFLWLDVSRGTIFLCILRVTFLQYEVTVL